MDIFELAIPFDCAQDRPWHWISASRRAGMTTPAQFVYNNESSCLGNLLINSTLSDYMITLFKIVIPAWIAGIQAPWMDFSLPSMALDTRFPAGMTSFRII